MPTDDRVREAFAPLATHEPSDAELDALVRRLDSGPDRLAPARRRGLGVAVAIAASCAAVVAALAALPSSDGAPDVWGDRPILAAAAAVAADQPPPDRSGRYRYTRTKQRFTYVAQRNGKEATDTQGRIVESWVGASWKGRQIAPAGQRSITGDATLRAELARRSALFATAEDDVFKYGDGPLATLDPRELPRDRDALARVLLDGIRANRWGGDPQSRGTQINMPVDQIRELLGHSIILLLAYARLDPDQRAALLDVLATQAETRDLGEVEDEAGREGRGVELAFPMARAGFSQIYRVIFDAASSEILQWSSRSQPDSRGRPHRTDVILDASYTDATGVRP